MLLFNDQKLTQLQITEQSDSCSVAGYTFFMLDLDECAGTLGLAGKCGRSAIPPYANMNCEKLNGDFHEELHLVPRWPALLTSKLKLKHTKLT